MTNGNDPINEVKSADGRTMCGNDETRKWVKDTNAFLGLTKREYFAAKNMAAFFSIEDETASSYIMSILDLPNTIYEYPKHYMAYISKLSVIAADALITELNKTP